MAAKYWLLKAEPDTRIVKGKDVRFSVDDFEAAKTSPWEGVRNYEARNLMKQMQIGDKALFYHSNCKNPGIAGFVEVSKEAYPDFTAWDVSHPYYDPKTKEDDPKWFMVDLTFISRAQHFVPLSLLRYIAENPSPPSEVDYLEETGAQAIKSMDLVTRGRLSVQKVDEKAWNAIVMLAEKGGWDDMELKRKKAGPTTKAATNEKAKIKTTGRSRGRPKAKKHDDDESSKNDHSEAQSEDEADADLPKTRTNNKKRKAKDDIDEDIVPVRRSTRTRR